MRDRFEVTAPSVRLALFLTAVGAAAFAILPISPPWWVRLGYIGLCHQIPERTLTLFGEPMAVCARCSGLYFGAALATLLAFASPTLLGRTLVRMLWLLWIPTAIDATIPWIGLPQLAIVPRHVLAWPAGFAAGGYVSLGVALIVTSNRRTLKRPLEIPNG